MTDDQVAAFVMKEHEAGSSQSQIVTKLMQRGVDIPQIRRVKAKYDRQINQSGMGMVADEAMKNAENRMRQNNGKKKEEGINKTVDETTSYRVYGERNYQQQYDENDPDFLLMQAELGGIIPVDSIALLEPKFRSILD